MEYEIIKRKLIFIRIINSIKITKVVGDSAVSGQPGWNRAFHINEQYYQQADIPGNRDVPVYQYYINRPLC